MKKTLKKIGLLVVVVLSSQLYCSSQKVQSNFSVQEFLAWDVKAFKASKPCQPAQMLALGNLSNLKSYHYGLQKLHSHYVVPTKESLMEQVYSHPSFIGKGLHDQPNPTQLPYFIFEKEPGHFYLASQRGIRHFTVNDYKKEGVQLAGLDNAAFGYYPSLGTFICCTLA